MSLPPNTSIVHIKSLKDWKIQPFDHFDRNSERYRLITLSNGREVVIYCSQSIEDYDYDFTLPGKPYPKYLGDPTRKKGSHAFMHSPHAKREMTLITNSLCNFCYSKTNVTNEDIVSLKAFGNVGCENNCFVVFCEDCRNWCKVNSSFPERFGRAKCPKNYSTPKKERPLSLHNKRTHLYMHSSNAEKRTSCEDISTVSDATFCTKCNTVKCLICYKWFETKENHHIYKGALCPGKSTKYIIKYTK